MRLRIIKTVSWLMTVVFLIGLSPKEYLHDTIFHHKDGVDAQCKKGEFIFYKKHIHCAFLGFEYAPFINSVSFFRAFEPIADYPKYVIAIYEYYFHTTYEFETLRGPPFCS